MKGFSDFSTNRGFMTSSHASSAQKVDGERHEMLSAMSVGKLRGKDRWNLLRADVRSITQAPELAGCGKPAKRLA